MNPSTSGSRTSRKPTTEPADATSSCQTREASGHMVLTAPPLPLLPLLAHTRISSYPSMLHTTTGAFEPTILTPTSGPTSPISTTSSGTSQSRSGLLPRSNQVYLPPVIGSNTSPRHPLEHGLPNSTSSHVPRKRPRHSNALGPGRSPRDDPTKYVSSTLQQRPPVSRLHSIPKMSAYPNPAVASPYGQVAPSTLPKRFTLHVRQQPRAARAGPDGKDRRTIDPPPVLQILIDDFDPIQDSTHLKANDWVVHAKLVCMEKANQDLNTMTPRKAEGTQTEKVTRLLLGTTVSSPFYCSDDPDPENAPVHPRTKATPPPSPSSFLFQKSKTAEREKKDTDVHKTYCGIYFIFADLSVRKAGQYRLEFRLMKMESPALQTGQFVAIISHAVSDTFNVVNAKDFDQVQPSTELVKGLIARGAGFPLKLKKGLREGQRRRSQADSSDDHGESNQPEDNDNNDDDDDDGDG